MKRAALYARVSTEKQEQEETIQSQIAALRNHAVQHDFQVVDEYIDNGWSGEILARPNLDRLRDDANQKLFDAVLIHSPDRLSRKYVYQEIIREELEKNGINLIFFNRPIADTPEDKMLLGIQGLMAEYEKAKILERTRRGRLHRAKQGIPLGGGFVTYGYSYILKAKDHHGYHEINVEEAGVVQLIFDLLVSHRMSTRGIVRELTARNIPPPKGGQKWAKSTVARMLRNETYTGTTYYNKCYYVETNHHRSQIKYRRRFKTGIRLRNKEEWIAIPVPAIITKDLYNIAQEQLKQNQALSPRNNKKYSYLLRGIVKCGICGSAFYGTPSHDKTYYRCGNRQRMFPLHKTCDASTIKTEVLDSLVWENIKRLIQNPQLLRSRINNHQESLDHKAEQADKKLKSHEREKEKLLVQEKRMIDAYGAGIINTDQLKEYLSGLGIKKGFLDDEMKKLNLEKEKKDNGQKVLRGFEEYCKDIKAQLSKVV